MYYARMKRGFSLVELSIVLVILGLLSGAILAGRSLIRASEMRAVTSQIEQLRTAGQTFREKYFYIPGDLPNAVSFWGEAASGSACKLADSTTLSDPRRTCNGNGNGTYQNWLTTSNEYFRAWQHLANAGLVQGTYSGVEGSGGIRHARIGLNVPAATLTNVGFSLEYSGIPDSSNSWAWQGNALNTLTVGGEDTTLNTYRASFRPDEAWNIDTKTDDGYPSTGKLRSKKDFTYCHTSQTFANAEYNVAYSSLSCNLTYYNFYY